jgi:SAM-dependent MidA family methyltransferase
MELAAAARMTEQTGNPALIAAIRAEIAANGGRISFARFMELALYHPEHGYYLQGERKPGRGGDFITAPEASAYFGLTLARQMAEFWERLGKPRRWVIREYGAGHGGLAYDLIAGLTDEFPDAAAGLQYRLVEPNARLVERAMAAMEEVGLAGKVVPEPADAEAEPIVGVALANEVADALPVHRLAVHDGRVLERFVTWRNGRFADLVDEPSPELTTIFDGLRGRGIDFKEGDQFEISLDAPAWFASVTSGIERGYVMTIDYGYPEAKHYAGHLLQGTVRGYAGHTVTNDPYLRVGEQDLTAHVDFSALIAAGEATGAELAGFTTQGAMLASLGLGEWMMRLQQEPDATMDEVMALRAVTLRLIDPGGLGRFGVLIMAKNAPIAPPLRSFATAAPAF